MNGSSNVAGWSPMQLAPLLRIFHERGLRASIVGGQAVSIWTQPAESLCPAKTKPQPASAGGNRSHGIMSERQIAAPYLQSGWSR